MFCWVHRGEGGGSGFICECFVGYIEVRGAGLVYLRVFCRVHRGEGGGSGLFASVLLGT